MRSKPCRSRKLAYALAGDWRRAIGGWRDLLTRAAAEWAAELDLLERFAELIERVESGRGNRN